MTTTEEQRIVAARRRLPDLDPDLIDDAIDTAHRRFGGRRVRDFVPRLLERAATTALNDTDP